MARGRKVVAAGGRYVIDAWVAPDDPAERRRSDGQIGEHRHDAVGETQHA